MKLEEFRPEGVTGDGDPQDFFYHSHLTGPQGAHYELLKERHHTLEDIKRAKRWLRVNFDVVSIRVIEKSYRKRRKPKSKKT